MTASGAKTLLRGGLLFDGARLREGIGVLIEGERIVAVEPFGQFAGHAGPVIDTTGGTLDAGADRRARAHAAAARRRRLRADRALGSRRFRHPGRREPSRLPRGRHRGGPRHVGTALSRDAAARRHRGRPHSGAAAALRRQAHHHDRRPRAAERAHRRRAGRGAQGDTRADRRRRRPRQDHGERRRVQPAYSAAGLASERSRARRLRRGGAPLRQAGREPRDRRGQRAQRGCGRRQFDRARFLDRRRQSSPRCASAAPGWCRR